MPEAPTRCLPFVDDLSALLDDELEAGREAELRAHVESCPHCSRVMHELCNVDLALASLAAPAVDSALRGRLAARLAREDAPRATPRPARPAPARRPRRGRVLGLAGALAAAAAVVLVLLLGLPRDVSQPAPPIAQAPAPPADPGAPPPEPTQTAREPAPAPFPVPEEAEPPEARLAARSLAPALEGVADEDVALLLELDEVEDLDLIANLDLLEALVDLAPPGGA